MLFKENMGSRSTRTQRSDISESLLQTSQVRFRINESQGLMCSSEKLCNPAVTMGQMTGMAV